MGAGGGFHEAAVRVGGASGDVIKAGRFGGPWKRRAILPLRRDGEHAFSDDAALDLGAHIRPSSDRLQANRDEIDFLHGDFRFDGVWPWFTVLAGNGHGDGGGFASGGVGVEFAQAEVIAGGMEGLGPTFGDGLLIQAGYFGNHLHGTRLLGEGGGWHGELEGGATVVGEGGGGLGGDEGGLAVVFRDIVISFFVVIVRATRIEKLELWKRGAGEIRAGDGRCPGELRLG